MKRSGLIFTGIVMLVLMLGLLFFAGAIYDSEQKSVVETYFFEPNTLSSQRVGAPVSPDSMTQNYLREKIIEHFLYEYFYVIPYETNARMRIEQLRNTDNTATMFNVRVKRDVVEKWRSDVGPAIQDLANKHGLQTVQLLDIADSESGYLIVDYKLKTWTKPNDVLAKPIETVGRMLINIMNKPIQISQTTEVLERLQQGIDPISAFDFNILDVIQE